MTNGDGRPITPNDVFVKALARSQSQDKSSITDSASSTMIDCSMRDLGPLPSQYGEYPYST